jgi:hypothetical protein
VPDPYSPWLLVVATCQPPLIRERRMETRNRDETAGTSVLCVHELWAMWVRKLFTKGLPEVELPKFKRPGARWFIPWFVTLSKFFHTRFLLVLRHSVSSPLKDPFSLDGPSVPAKD